MAKSHNPDYRTILVKNEASGSTVFLFVYASWDPICWISFESKSILPNKYYLYRSTASFKYELRIKRGKEKRRIILPPTLWKQNKRLLVTNYDDIIEDDLSSDSFEQRICVRRNNMAEETSAEHGRDLYAILKLDMKEVRKKSKREQDDIIRKAYQKQIRLLHPDRNPDLPDSHLCQEITMVYSILADREKRAKYHDVTDYSGGWLSRSRWKAIFHPEAHGGNEKCKRIGLLCVSTLSVIGGTLVTVLTAGYTAPVVIACNAIGGATIGAGIQSALRTVCYDSISNGAEVKKFLQSFAVGGMFGAISGGATAGIALATVGIGSTAIPVADVCVTDYLTSGAAAGTVSGLLAAVSSDVDKAFVDGQDVSWKEFASHTLAGAAAGAVTGAAGGAATKCIHARASTATIEGEGAEQAFTRWATQKAIKHAPTMGKMIENTGKKTLNTGLSVVEEKIKDQAQANSIPEIDDLIKQLRDQNIHVKEAIFSLYHQTRYHSPSAEEETGVIRYICEVWSCKSRIVVEYLDARNFRTKMVAEGSRAMVEIPEKAIDITVKFQILRSLPVLGPTWGDVKTSHILGINLQYLMCSGLTNL